MDQQMQQCSVIMQHYDRLNAQTVHIWS